MTILITGANRGIGQRLVEHYKANGETVIGTTRGTAAAPEWLQLDVTNPDAHRALAHTLDGVAIDMLVCNAGVYLDKGQNLAEGYPADMWAQTFATNVTGVFLTIQALLPNLQMAPTSKIAIISSIMASDAGAPGGSYIYRASKAAVLNLGRNLARDLSGLGIAVGIYHPGWVQTDMGSAAADLTLDEAVPALASRFDALSIETTGCFESYDGTTIPF